MLSRFSRTSLRTVQQPVRSYSQYGNRFDNSGIRPGAPSADAAKPQNAPKENNLPIIIGSIIVAGGAYLYFGSDERAAKGRAELRHGEEKVEQVYHSAVDGVKHKYEDLKEDRRSISQEASDILASQRNAAGSKFDTTAGAILGKGQEIKDDIKDSTSSWLDSSSIGAKRENEVGVGKYDGEREAMRREYERQKQAVSQQYEHDKEVLKGKGEEVKNESKGWYNWFFPSPPTTAENAKLEADSAFKRASSSIPDATNRTNSALSDATNRASDALSSTANQTSNYIDEKATQAGRTVRENVSAAENLAKKKSDDLENYAQERLDSTRDYVNATKEGVKESGRSWFYWGGKEVEEGKAKVREAKDDLGRKASGVKENLKDGLLAAEKKVEEGSQKAQEKTRKL